MNERPPQATLWVVKVGSSLVTAGGKGLDHQAINHWALQLIELRRQACQVVLVSSGAIAEGMHRLQWRQRPHALHEQQAAAAVGQAGLVEAYERCFRTHGLHTAQILLTREDLSDRKRYLNARSTLRTLLKLGVIPIVNENDTVASDEIRFGDNDTLAALVTNLIEADLLVLLTDQDGLYDKNPKQHADARLIRQAKADDAYLKEIAGPSLSGLGRGGMQTKVEAARRAARSGAATIIASGHSPNILAQIHAGNSPGTLLLAERPPLLARKQWLANQLGVRGRLHIDAGASLALQRAASLLAVGVVQVEGDFRRGELVACINPEGREIARGLVNYNADESRKIRGQASRQIEALLGYVDEPELIDRDNLVLIDA